MGPDMNLVALLMGFAVVAAGAIGLWAHLKTSTTSQRLWWARSTFTLLVGIVFVALFARHMWS